MKKISILILVVISINLNAQNEIDALRYSEQNIFGTAKFNSMGGAFGSLGGDFTSLSYNPAGIALYQNAELSFTPSLSMNEMNSSINGNNFTNNKFGSNISNFGFVAVGSNNDEQWKRINIGFGWNQLANYNNKYEVNVINSTSSFSEILLNQANGTTIDNLNSFGAGPAFWTDLIDLENNFVDTATGWYAFDNGNYILNVNPLSEKTQNMFVNSNGHMGEFVFSLGSSFEERIYFGATIGIPSIEYSEEKKYTESNFSDSTLSFNSFNYGEKLNTYGTGVNLKFGAILRIGDKTKIGASFHTPSYLSMEEEYSTSITTNITENSPIGYFNYEIITPWKIIGSFSTILQEKILISAEIDKIDYSFTRMYSDYYTFSEENNIIEETYSDPVNIRIGGEANLHPFKLRLGYALYGSPYKERPEYETENLSTGIGIDFGSTFFDMSYTISKNSGIYSIYNQENEPLVMYETEKHYILFTLGFRY